MFSKSCQYAIRAVLYLAVNAQPEQKTGAKEVAEALNVPSPFLAKILQQLARHGLVSSSKGAGGGFYLQEQDLQVTLSQIIDCIDGKGAMSACVLGLPVCSSENPCPLHFKALSYRSGLEKLIQGQTVGQLAKKIISKKLSLQKNSHRNLLEAFRHQPEIVMKYTFGLLLFALLFLSACSGHTSSPDQDSESPPPTAKVDDGKGIGEVKSVKLNVPLKPALVDEGKSIYELKCAACHKLTDKRVVGPGWAGLTSKRKPEWIMNMITNVEVMLAEDPTAQKLLEECLTRMPNQNLTIDDSRAVLEFMYANDGHEVGN